VVRTIFTRYREFGSMGALAGISSRIGLSDRTSPGPKPRPTPEQEVLTGLSFSGGEKQRGLPRKPTDH
jgi:hypothetical protein